MFHCWSGAKQVTQKQFSDSDDPSIVSLKVGGGGVLVEIQGNFELLTFLCREIIKLSIHI